MSRTSPNKRCAWLIVTLCIEVALFGCKSGQIPFGSDGNPIQVESDSPLPGEGDTGSTACTAYAIAASIPAADANGASIALTFTPPLCAECTATAQLGKSGEAPKALELQLAADRGSATAATEALEPGTSYDLLVAIPAQAACPEQEELVAVVPPPADQKTWIGSFVGCQGRKFPIVLGGQEIIPDDNNSDDLMVIPGSALPLTCDSTPLKAEEVQQALVASPGLQSWLGMQAAQRTEQGEVLASFWKNPWQQYEGNDITVYQAFRLFDSQLQTDKFLNASQNHSFAIGERLNAFIDLDHDGFKDFIAITKSDKVTRSPYFLELFPGSDAGLITTSAWAQPLPVTNPISRQLVPIQMTASPSGLVAVTIDPNAMLQRIIRTLVYDAVSKTLVGTIDLVGMAKETTTICGSAILDLAQGPSLALCVPKGNTAKIFVTKIQPMKTIDVSQVAPHVALTQQVPLSMQVMNNMLYLLAPKQVAVFDPVKVAGGGLIDPWALADRTFQLEEDDYPFEIALQDYDGDGTTDTLIKVRKHSYYGDRIFKIFLDQATSACQILRFSNCEPPEKG